MTEATSLPSTLLAWLAPLFGLVLLWLLIVIGMEIRKKGIGMTSVSTLVFLVLAGVLVIKGRADYNALLQSREFMKSLPGLTEATAKTDDLEKSLKTAKTDEDRRLAFSLFGHQQPDQALKWLENPANELIKSQPDLKAALQTETAPLHALLSVEELRLGRRVKINDKETLLQLGRVVRPDQPLGEWMKERRVLVPPSLETDFNLEMRGIQARALSLGAGALPRTAPAAAPAK